MARLCFLALGAWVILGLVVYGGFRIVLAVRQIVGGLR
jgi:hypothetical protein